MLLSKSSLVKKMPILCLKLIISYLLLFDVEAVELHPVPLIVECNLSCLMNSFNCCSRSIFTRISSDSGPWMNSSLIWHELMRRIHVNHICSLANIIESPVSSMSPRTDFCFTGFFFKWLPAARAAVTLCPTLKNSNFLEFYLDLLNHEKIFN